MARVESSENDKTSATAVIDSRTMAALAGNSWQDRCGIRGGVAKLYQPTIHNSFTDSYPELALPVSKYAITTACKRDAIVASEG